MAPRPFGDYLGEIDQGRLLESLAESFRDVIEAAYDTGKKGNITLTLEVEPGKKSGVMELRVKLKTNRPGRDIPPSVYYITPESNLTREAPQGELGGDDWKDPTPLHVVDKKREKRKKWKPAGTEDDPPDERTEPLPGPGRSKGSEQEPDPTDAA